jgi:hypothetical protein
MENIGTMLSKVIFTRMDGLNMIDAIEEITCTSMEPQFAPDRCTWGRLSNIVLPNVDVNMQSLGLHFISPEIQNRN